MPRAKYEATEDNEGAHDPLIEALLTHLPAPGEAFPDRKLWMQILDLSLQLIYPEEEAGGAGA